MKESATDEDKRWLEPSQYADGKDETDPSKTYNTLYSASLIMDDYSSNLNSGNVFSKSLLTPTNLGYEAADHFLVTEIVADTAAENISNNLVVYLVTSINKNGKVYKYRSKDFSFEKIRSNGGRAQFSVLLPPQINNKNYEIVTYAYINESAKVKLLSLITRVLKVQ
ncbi:MAG: hypothetical protein H0X46_06370 [Bacteroidetes bacterium]|nr:hypothetical protein [Bacteroidota bacterium]